MWEKIALRLWGRIPKTKKMKEKLLRRDSGEIPEGSLLHGHLRSLSNLKISTGK